MQIPKPVSPDEFQAIYKGLDNSRDKLIIILLYGTGYRVGELVSTRVKDVDLQEGVIHLLASRTKTRQYRSVVMPSEVLTQLDAWMKTLPGSSKWLFPGQGDGHITERRIRQIVDRAAKKAGIQRAYGHDKNGRPLYVVSPHSLRHCPCGHCLGRWSASERSTGSVNANLEHRKKSYEQAKFGLLD